MNASWIMPVGNRRVEGYDEGLRPSGERLLALVDPNDPALLDIIDVLQEMRDAGTDINEETTAQAVEMGKERRRLGFRRPVPSPMYGGSIVYYARRSGLVKIGTTANPEQRFAALVPDEILAWEPGSISEERSRHREFATHRLGGSEYFVMHDRLSALTQDLRSQYGEPSDSWITLATVHRIRAKNVGNDLPVEPSVQLVTAVEAVTATGVRRNTFDVWISRGRVTPIGRNAGGRPLYRLDQIQRLAAGPAA